MRWVRLVGLTERILLPAGMGLAVWLIERQLNKAIRGRQAKRRQQPGSSTKLTSE
jgi:hypothetical protein